jgi:hypothetical protein
MLSNDCILDAYSNVEAELKRTTDNSIMFLMHCYNRKVCLPVIPGEGAVSFMTVWFFPHKNFAISRG